MSVTRGLAACLGTVGGCVSMLFFGCLMDAFMFSPRFGDIGLWDVLLLILGICVAPAALCVYGLLHLYAWCVPEAGQQVCAVIFGACVVAAMVLILHAMDMGMSYVGHMGSCVLVTALLGAGFGGLFYMAADA